jgi:hypothetical protein
LIVSRRPRLSAVSAGRGSLIKSGVLWPAIVESVTGCSWKRLVWGRRWRPSHSVPVPVSLSPAPLLQTTIAVSVGFGRRVFSLSVHRGGTGGRNVAVTDLSPLIVTMHEPLPWQPAPDQPANLETGSKGPLEPGPAMRVTVCPAGKPATHEPWPQYIRDGTLVT